MAERTDARRIFAGNLLPALRKKKITQAAASLSRLENAPINGAVGEEEEEEEEDRLDIGQIRGWEGSERGQTGMAEGFCAEGEKKPTKPLFSHPPRQELGAEFSEPILL